MATFNQLRFVLCPHWSEDQKCKIPHRTYAGCSARPAYGSGSQFAFVGAILMAVGRPHLSIAHPYRRPAFTVRRSTTNDAESGHSFDPVPSAPVYLVHGRRDASLEAVIFDCRGTSGQHSVIIDDDVAAL
jgi:hypothetical protein